MLCKKCMNRLGPSYKYLVKMVEEYKTEDKGMDMLRLKILNILTENESRINDVEGRLEKIELRLRDMGY